MKYKCLIICNEKENILRFENLIKLRRELKHFKTLNSLAKAVSYFNSDKNTQDMVFIDFNSKNQEEMSMIQEIKKRCKYCVCFSEYAHRAKDSYDVGLNDFLQTPIITGRFNICVDRMLEHIIREPDAHLLVRRKRGDNQMVMLYYRDICVIESNGNYVKFITKDHTYTRNYSLSAIAKKLRFRPEFMQIHKSFIISTDHIEHIKGMSQVKIHGKKEMISISNPYKNKYKEFIEGDFLQPQDKTDQPKLSAVNQS